MKVIEKKYLFGHDYLNFSKYQLEMSLQIALKDKIKPMVIPTKKYEELPESKDKNALHKCELGKIEKEDLYEKFKN